MWISPGTGGYWRAGEAGSQAARFWGSAVLGLHAAPTGTLAGSEQLGPGPSGKAFHVEGLLGPRQAAPSCRCPLPPAAPASRSARYGPPPAHPGASGLGLDGQPMTFM